MDEGQVQFILYMAVKVLQVGIFFQKQNVLMILYNAIDIIEEIYLRSKAWNIFSV